MLRRNLALIIALIAVPMSIHATDLQQTVSGDDETENSLENSKATADNTYVSGGDMTETVDSVKDTKGVDYIFDHGVKEVSDSKVTPKKQFEDFGYTTPGTFEKQENYIDLDKKKYTKDFRKYSSGGINLAFIKNNYDYQSTNDVINRTIGSGYKSVKGGSLHIRNDSFFVHTDYLNMHWSLGGGVGYNSGKGIFASTGQQSDATFNLWEIPVDAGLGLEIPIAHWFKIAGTGGGSIMTLMQNRSDFQRGEKGKRKFQFSPGYFANAQFKINLTGFSEEAAYEMFTSSEITNLFMNLEIRHENYGGFKDDIKISGTSFGIGFTFEYL